MSLRSLESGFRMIAMILRSVNFFLDNGSDHSDRSNHMETRLKKFHVVVVQQRQNNCTKKRDALAKLLF